MSSSILKTTGLCLSLASAGCLQATEPIHAPPATSAQSLPTQSARPASTAEPITAGQAIPDLPSGLFPLDIGNRWRYSFTSTISGPGYRVVGLIATTTIELVGRIRIGPFDYVEARIITVETIPAIGITDTLAGSIAYREDFDGLYEIPNLPQTSPPILNGAVVGRGSKVTSAACALSPPWFALLAQPPILPQEINLAASSSVLANPTEIKLLSYPLHQGTTWTTAYPIQATVERVDVLDLPIGRLPAYRVRTFLPGLEDHLIQSWWSRRGLLKERRYYRETCVDPICPPPDTFGEDILTVEEIHLSKDPSSPN